MTQDAIVPQPIPQQIGRYKIEGLMTRGGMSLLYLATLPETEEPIIIKVLLPQFLTDADVVQRFLNEAHLIALANHPNVVRLIDSGEWHGGLFIAMEFVKGTSLRKILNQQPYSLKRAIEVLLQIAYAIAHLHGHGIVHGDLKPENILINEEGQVKVIDFGIAQLLTDKKRPLPRRFVGTPIYMSPELGLDAHLFSFQSDIYALGIIAYELAIGKISHGRVIISLAPRGLQKILHKALQPRPEDRYTDMCDFIADVASYIKSGAIQKDKQGSDYFLEVFEELEGLQSTILPNKAIQNADIEVGLVSFQNVGLSGQCADILDLPGHKKVLLVAESQQKGATGVVSACVLRAVFRSHLSVHACDTSEVCLKNIHELLRQHAVDQKISFSLLLLDCKSGTFEFLHNGYGILAHFDRTLELVTTHEKDCKGNFKHDDQFALIGALKQDDKLLPYFSKDLGEVFKEAPSQSIQSRAEGMLRKLRMRTQAELEELSYTLVLLRILNSYGK